MMTASQLWQMMPAAHATVIDLYYPYFVSLTAQYGICTQLEEAHFYAQVGHESGDLRYTEEIASGVQYEGRKDLGNIIHGDGPLFKGRGFIQLTGRANYSVFGYYKQIDLTTPPNPDRVATDPSLCVEVACWYWKTHRINDYADEDNLQAVTRAINGGLNGLQDRATRLLKCKQVLGPIA